MDTYGYDCFQAQARCMFGDEVGMTVWQAINAVFKVLPLAACIDGKIFCSHGGIPRYYGPQETDDRLKILQSPEFPRLRSLFEPLDMSVLGKEKMEQFWVAAFDLMWSDPSDDDSEVVCDPPPLCHPVCLCTSVPLPQCVSVCLYIGGSWGGGGGHRHVSTGGPLHGEVARGL